MTNFKPGDKVVCIHPTIKPVYNGVYTVEWAHDNIVSTYEAEAFGAKWLELEVIANSPLYKALE